MREQQARELLQEELRRIRGVQAIEQTRWASDTDPDLFSELAHADQHQADAAAELLEREIDASILSMEDERLADVAHALRRLASGTYGTCETCGDAIPDERLLAEPATRFCVDHQRGWELHRVDVGVPPAVGDATIRSSEPHASLDSLTDESGDEDASDRSAEQEAMHVEQVD